MDERLLQALTNITDSLDYLSETLSSNNTNASSDVTKALLEGDFVASINNLTNKISELTEESSKIIKNQDLLISGSLGDFLNGVTDSFNNIDSYLSYYLEAIIQNSNLYDNINKSINILNSNLEGLASYFSELQTTLLSISPLSQNLNVLNFQDTNDLLENISNTIIEISENIKNSLNESKPNLISLDGVIEILKKINENTILISQDVNSLLNNKPKINNIENINLDGIIEILNSINENLSKYVENETLSLVNNEGILNNINEKLTSITETLKITSQGINTLLERSSTETIAERSDGDKNIKEDELQNSLIKKGATAILAIAGSVVAIGAALMLVKDVDISAAVGLSVAITAIAFSYKKIAESDIDMNKVLSVSGALVLLSTSILASSLVLSMIRPVSIDRILTAVAIGGGFSLLMPHLIKITKDIGTINPLAMLATAVYLPVIFSSLSMSILSSSSILSGIVPVDMNKIATAIAIAGGFAILSYSLKNIFSSLGDVNLKSLLLAPIVIPIVFPALSLGIALSSGILNTVKPVGLPQLITATLIAGTFALLSYSFSNMMKGLKNANSADMIEIATASVFIFPGLAAAIALSSHFISQTTPINLTQFLSAAAVSGLFVVLSYALKPLAKGFEGTDLGKLASYVLFAPAIFTSLSLAIMASSSILNQVTEVSMNKLITSALISGTFVVLAYALRPLSKNLKDIDYADIAKATTIFPALSLAIMLSSHLIDKSADVSAGRILTFTLIGLALAGTSFVLAKTMDNISKISPAQLAKGAGAILIIATTVSLASHILNAGNYEDYPSLEWATGVGLTMLAFGAGAFGLGTLVLGPQGLIFAAGLGTILGVAGIITATSHILKMGDYNIPNYLEWAKGTSLLFLTFTPAIMALGAMAVGSALVSLFGPNPFEEAKSMITSIANTIVDTSHILSKGNYAGGPTEEWASGISIALGAFSPIYSMLVRSQVASILGGDISPEKFSDSIQIIARGITTSAEIFAASNASFKNPPPLEWARGVKTSLEAFAPIYKMLVADNILGSLIGGIGPDDFATAIETIARGINTAANVLAEGNSSYINGPTAKWASGVKTSLEAFSPIYSMLMADNYVTRLMGAGVSPEDFSSAIETISRGITTAANVLAEGNSSYINGPTLEWATGVKTSLEAFAPVYKMLLSDIPFFGVSPSDFVNAIELIARGINKAASIFAESGGSYASGPSEEWGKNVSSAIQAFMPVMDIISNSGFFGPDLDELTKGVSLISNSIVASAVIFESSNATFDTSKTPSEQWTSNVKNTVLLLSELYTKLDNDDIDISDLVEMSNDLAYLFNKVGLISSEINGAIIPENLDFSNFYEGVLSTEKGVIYQLLELNRKIDSELEDYIYSESSILLSKKLVKVASILSEGSSYFQTNIDPNYVSSISKNILDFNKLLNDIAISEQNNGLSGILNIFADDPIIRIAERISILSESYDKLASSLKNMGSSMATINISSYKELSDMTKELSSVSEGGKGPSVVSSSEPSVSTTILPTTEIGTKAENYEILTNKLDRVIELLANIDKSSGSIDLNVKEIVDETDDSLLSSFNPFS